MLRNRLTLKQNILVMSGLFLLPHNSTVQLLNKR